MQAHHIRTLEARITDILQRYRADRCEVNPSHRDSYIPHRIFSIRAYWSGGIEFDMVLTEEEIYNGDTERWLHELERNADYALQRSEEKDHSQRIRRQERYHTEYLQNFHTPEFILPLRDSLIRDLYQPDEQRIQANARALALFTKVLGQEATDQVKSPKGLPLKGSLGTDYALHARVTYCVTRPKDGARMCAVVPGVPLYDHLLGIKLMIERDEPEFLRVANVSAPIDIPTHFNCRSTLMPNYRSFNTVTPMRNSIVVDINNIVA